MPRLKAAPIVEVMCGIAGIYTRGGAAPSRDLLLTMGGELRHRGPDGTGLFLQEDLGMVATRLAIIDLDTGDQPLSNEDGRFWVVQNGEIYNYIELREELEELGHRFATTCDTEVIAHAYARWGEECLARLNGEFAFAVWDTRDKELFLARDRFGVRPLFVAELAGNFCFASEVKALLRHPHAQRELDAAAIVELFTTWSNVSGRSAFTGIRELEPGCRLRVTRDGIQHRRWWDLSFEPSPEIRPDADWIDELREVLDDATRIRLRADVEVSLYMSGGLDSTLLTAFARGHAEGRLSLFGVGFEDALYDESSYQDLAAKAFDGKLSRATVGSAEIAELLPRVVELAERPMLRTAPAPLLRLAGTVRESGRKVVVTGEGADELFGGYDIFREDKVRRFCARDPESPWRPVLYTRLNEYLRADLTKVGGFLGSFYGRDLTATNDPLYSHRIRFLNTGRAVKVLAGDVLERAADEQDPLAPLAARLPEGFDRFTPLGRAQYLEIVTFLEGYLLHSQGDRMLMGHSVEGRFPYLDHRVAELAARLPDRLKLLGLGEKYALRRVARDLIPPEIVARRKHPYRAPIATVLLEGLFDVVEPKRLRAAGLLDEKAVGALVTKIRSKGAEGVSETDEMALVGATTTMLLHDRLVASPSLAPAALPTKVVHGDETGSPAEPAELAR